MKYFSPTFRVSQASAPLTVPPSRRGVERSILDVPLLSEESSNVSQDLERTKEISALEVKSPRVI